MEKYYGKVIKVIDGDTFKVKNKSGDIHTIRLLGVDTPEKKQEHGALATEFTKNLIEGRTVFVVPVSLGRYGRIVAHVKLDDVAIAETMLKAGMCFASGNNHKYANLFYSLEQKARINNTGIWKTVNQNPYEYRRNNKFRKVRNNPLYKQYSKEVTDRPDIKLTRPKKSLLNHLMDFIDKFNKDEDYLKYKQEVEMIKARQSGKDIDIEKLEDKNKKEKDIYSIDGLMANIKRKLKP